MLALLERQPCTARILAIQIGVYRSVIYREMPALIEKKIVMAYKYNGRIKKRRPLIYTLSDHGAVAARYFRAALDAIDD